MQSKTAQWIICAILMLVFTVLTLAARWLDLTLAMTAAAVFWYGIVPISHSGENNSTRAKSR